MRSSKFQFIALSAFLCATLVVVTNAFAPRIFAQGPRTDPFHSIEPIGAALHEILSQYVDDPDVDKVVEGALIGMMRSLDRHSAYVPPQEFTEMHEDTQGEFFGIGVSIELDENENVQIRQTIPNTPAAASGLFMGDIILEVDGQPIAELEVQGERRLGGVANLIKGPEGTIVSVKVFRPGTEGADGEVLDFDIKRGRIPLESIVERRLLEGGIGYIRLTDFKSNTAADMERAIKDFRDNGMRAMVLDLRWNRGGLLTASQEVSELFLPKNTLVTYTRGRSNGPASENMVLRTRKNPVLPADMPLIVLVTNQTASSAEIVTGALQFHERAIVVGEKTYGKGSVQTIIPLERPQGSALRLTTALYYTPADVTIDESGIEPDVEEPMDIDTQRALLTQMWRSYAADPSMEHEQNHGPVTGNTEGELDSDGEQLELVQDNVLQRAVDILNEDTVWSNLVERYHRPASETQVAAADRRAKDEGEGL
jgi:carboxyl-terminal processing protease